MEEEEEIRDILIFWFLSFLRRQESRVFLMYFSDTILRTFGSKSTKTIGGGKTRSNFALLIYKPVFFTARKFFLYIIFSGRIFGQVSSPKPRYIAINYLFFACIYSSLITLHS
jgi:hypothetical protein